jgi:putative addiction module killer protein
VAVTVQVLEEFADWISGLRDKEARAKIDSRLRRLAQGNPGDVKPVGGGVSEMRIHHGPGYRVYFQQRNNVLVVILCGGDKRTQSKDIARAIEIARTIED